MCFLLFSFQSLVQLRGTYQSFILVSIPNGLGFPEHHRKDGLKLMKSVIVNDFLAFYLFGFFHNNLLKNKTLSCCIIRLLHTVFQDLSSTWLNTPKPFILTVRSMKSRVMGLRKLSPGCDNQQMNKQTSKKKAIRFAN